MVPSSFWYFFRVSAAFRHSIEQLCMRSSCDGWHSNSFPQVMHRFLWCLCGITIRTFHFLLRLVGR